MAGFPSAQTSALRILSIYLEHDLKAGDVLPASRFVAPFSKPGWSLADFETGMAYAIAEDWIELVSLKSYRLTELGFLQA